MQEKKGNVTTIGGFSHETTLGVSNLMKINLEKMTSNISKYDGKRKERGRDSVPLS